jgi:hypothetical protein
LGILVRNLKNLGKKPVAARSARALVRTPLARNPYFGGEHLDTPIRRPRRKGDLRDRNHQAVRHRQNSTTGNVIDSQSDTQGGLAQKDKNG